jgi:uncharacterized protein YigA (DUF484 family)
MKQNASHPDSQPNDFESRVADYLSEHLDFFQSHPDLLAAIEIPHASGAAVSLIERQVESLRKQLSETRQELKEVMDIAAHNHSLQERMHRLTLELIDAATFDEVLNALEDELHDDFKADAMELRLFSSSRVDEHLEGKLREQAETFQQFFSQNQPICGQLEPEQLNYIFGAESDRIASTALIPLKSEGVLGLLAIGSVDPKRFAPHHGTEFLTRLGEIISRTLQAVSLPGI